MAPKSSSVSTSSEHFGKYLVACRGDGQSFGSTYRRISTGAQRFVESANQFTQTRVSRLAPSSAQSKIRGSGKNCRATAQKGISNLVRSRDRTGFNDAVSVKKIGMHTPTLPNQTQSVDRGPAVHRDQHRDRDFFDTRAGAKLSFGRMLDAPTCTSNYVWQEPGEQGERSGQDIRDDLVCVLRVALRTCRADQSIEVQQGANFFDRILGPENSGLKKELVYGAQQQALGLREPHKRLRGLRGFRQGFFDKQVEAGFDGLPRQNFMGVARCADVRGVRKVRFENTDKVRSDLRFRVAVKELRCFLFVAIYDGGNCAASSTHGVGVPLSHQSGAHNHHARTGMRFRGRPLHRLESLDSQRSPKLLRSLLR